ncbi:LPXTG cell wall anchor domain-containing protein [Pseudolactococcus paracarnosus]|uniref:LPXTG cell wall anchor domain-containing protein n=1 Tax=Pseudolactococcus paracarnosus TaxID=2749962 RepID=A0A7L4WED4_9LACT|nr:LPXTG cell wall anchor domain-containing protein [Lactococcus paracarnosus]SPC35790.1 exported hypothetical protein [Lactococcus piscium]MCJ1976540.1 LPXTG cell wall anchor domain-containing protein [Lactococcus paracarnosus]MCJ1982669.1 LPXTG cell wall anchor domain-containing protein [Lactococcus paracarnosus]MCJ1994506.1 LPXTG cell wall anchor domain-containing protein [Lactococcus paracarnosus]MCJ1997715.1 LPXTG cell wall anchor domain-containing protein [Lactococcus paracarnosus]
MNFKKLSFVLMFITVLTVFISIKSEVVKADVADQSQSTGTIGFYGTYPTPPTPPQPQPDRLPDTGETKDPMIQIIGGSALLIIGAVSILNNRKKKN